MSLARSTDPARFGKVAVVMGGWSAERSVSLMSGQRVHEALAEAGVDAHPVDAGRDIALVLRAGAFDRAFLILHGRGGEDGQVQGALELAGIPFTGSGVLGSALCMDKWRSKAICRECGIPVAEAERVDSLAELEQAGSRLGLPVVVKPVFEGSSLGVSIVQGTQQLGPAWQEAARFGTVMVERFIAGTEVTCAVLGSEALPLASIHAASGFYDFDAKYAAEDTRYCCPAELPAELARQIQAHALNAFAALAGEHWGRIDFIVDAQMQPWFIECNTAPGMTSHSLVPMAAAEHGLSFAALCLVILESTLPASEVPA